MFKFILYNKNIKRIVSLCVIFAVALSCFAVMSSCGEEGRAAMTLTYGKNTTVISANIYSYYLSLTKTQILGDFYITMANQFGLQLPSNLNEWEDMPDLWTEQYAEGSPYTWGDLVRLQAEDSLKQLLAIRAYCKENDIKLTKDQNNNIDELVKEIMKDAKYGNSKARFNAYLLRYNIDDSIYKEIQRLEVYAGACYKDLFDTATGKNPITYEMVEEAYQNNCSRVKHILIRYSPGTRDVEGNEEQYSEEELAERHAKVDDIYSRIMNGEDYDSFLEESEDTGASLLPDGYTVGSDTPFMPEFLNAALTMEIGEVRKVETSYGMHIMKRFELLPPEQSLDLSTEDAWINNSNLVREARRVVIAEVLKPYLDAVVIHAEETEVFDISTSLLMFDSTELWSKE